MARRANNLDGKTWLKNSISIWNDLPRDPLDKKCGHPAVFPQELVNRLIDSFVLIEGSSHKPVICDPFLGSGTSLLAAARRNLSGIGFELSPGYYELACSRLEDLGQWERVIKEDDSSCSFIAADKTIKIYQGDARVLGENICPDTLDLTITSPPYWDIMNQRRSADKKSSRPYSDDKNDLSNIEQYQDFIQEQQLVFKPIFNGTRDRGYLAVVVMDIRKGDRFYPLHMDMTMMLNDIGFVLDDIIIWDRSREYNNLRPLGYPYVFRVNKVHEYIMVFQKR